MFVNHAWVEEEWTYQSIIFSNVEMIKVSAQPKDLQLVLVEKRLNVHFQTSFDLITMRHVCLACDFMGPIIFPFFGYKHIQ